MWLMGGDETSEGFEESGRTKAKTLSASVSDGDRVLEVGCGVGRIMKYLAIHCGELHGLDVSNRMLSRARDRLADIDNVQLHRGNGRDLRDLADGTFDFCYSIQVFQVIQREDTMRYLSEINRVLKSGGGIYAQFLDFEVESKAMAFRDYALESTVLKASRNRYHTASEVVMMVKVCGFEEIDIVRDGQSILLSASKPVPAKTSEPVASTKDIA